MLFGYGTYGSTYGSSLAASEAIVGVGVALILFILAICAVIAVFQIIGTWKILKKGGQPGWGALIPFYNNYLLCKMTGVNPWWILVVLLGGTILNVIPVVGSLLSMAISIYFLILLNVSIARSFDKDDGFAVGLILLAPVFYFILGIGKDEYKGANPMNDIVLNKFNEVTNRNTNSNQQTRDFSSSEETVFCSKCGAKVDKDTKFCPSCGEKM